MHVKEESKTPRSSFARYLAGGLMLDNYKALLDCVYKKKKVLLVVCH